MPDHRYPPTSGSPFTRDLNLLLVRTCNAACSHCSVESSPQDRRAMSDEVLDGCRELVEAFAGLPGAERVVVTGGEPFLRRRELERVAAAAKRVGLKVGVETNGYWATTPAKAAEVVAEVGIDDYMISASRFHAEFVPTERALTAWSAARAAGRGARVRVAHTTPPSEEEERLLAAVRAVVPEGSLDLVAVSAVGRASSTGLGGQGAAAALPLADLCPADGPMVDESGRVHPCCNHLSTVPDHALQLGTVGVDAGAEIVRRLEQDAVFHAIRRGGFGALLDLLPEPARRAAERHLTGDVCIACRSLFGDPALRPAIDELRARLAAPVSRELSSPGAPR